MKQLPAHSVAVTGTPASSVHACIKRIFLSGPNTSTLHPNSLTVLYPTGEFRESMSGVPKFMMIEPVKCPSSSVLRVFWCTWGARKENFRNGTWCVIINPGPLPRYTLKNHNTAGQCLRKSCTGVCSNAPTRTSKNHRSRLNVPSVLKNS